MKFKAEQFMFGFLTLYSSISFASSLVTRSFIVPGVTSYQRWSEQPIIISAKPNQDWTFAAIAMPYARTMDLLGMNCIEQSKCVMAGFYQPYSNMMLQQPLIISSFDGDWHFIKKIHNLPTVNFGGFTSVACNQKHCLIGGFYDNFNNYQLPVLIVSGRGSEWDTVTNITIPNDMTQSNIFSLLCADERHCFASGNYITNHNQQLPLLLHSTDAGDSWSFTNIDAFPKSSIASLPSLSCADKTCFAAGFYTKNKTFPVLVMTKDNGQSWSTVNTLPYPATMTAGQFSKIKCTQHTCLALGSYATKTSDYNILLFISTDDGLHWKTATDKTDLTNLTYLELKDATCTAIGCIIIGTFNNANAIEHPLILNIQPDGNEWLLVRNKSYSFQPEDEVLNALTCKENECVISGDSDQFPHYQAPLILTSNDAGMRWGRVDNIINMDKGNYTRFKLLL